MLEQIHLLNKALMFKNTKTPIIIAEAGVNHNGELENAFKLVDIAKDAGATYIKFQIFNPDKLVDQKIGLANYQKKNLNKKLTQYNMLKKLSLGIDKFSKIIKYCKKKNIKFIATPFDVDSLKFLKKNKVDFIKISSSDLNNFEILSEVIKCRINLILSSGLSNFKEIKETLNFLYRKKFNRNKITLLHCTSNYPTPIEDANLRVITSLNKTVLYNYTIINNLVDDFTDEYLENEFGPILINQVRTNPGLSSWRENNVTFKYHYSDKNGVSIKQYTITPEMYNQ